MALPEYITIDEEVIFGGGPAALAYAATRRALGHPPCIVLEKRKEAGGMFGPLAIFRMNSANNASLQSVQSPGPTRIPSLSPTDDLNWIPNAPYQVNSTSGMVAYPYSNDFYKTVQKGLREVARVYTDADATFDYTGEVRTNQGRVRLGSPKRVLWAAGLVEPSDLPKGPSIISGYKFMQRPVRELENKKIALVGCGATAAQIAEWMFGDGVGAPYTPPTMIHWYGDRNLPLTKKQWTDRYHARFFSVGRHLPEEGDRGDAILRPYPERGEVIPLGGTALVNGQNYDLVIMATGFVPAPSPVAMATIMRFGNMQMARYYDNGNIPPRLLRIGTAANLTNTYVPGPSRFAAASQALYNLLPATAALAASLP